MARRSDGLMNFVSSYRRLTRLNQPNKKRISVTELFEQIQRLACQRWQEKGVKLSVQVEPHSLAIQADPDMIEQVLLNLLQNAEHAVAGCEQPEVKLSAQLNPRGHTVIEVEDNGCGIEEEVASKVFVPFFTTKNEGSGVGLALTRQIMLAHEGQVVLSTQKGEGAKFSLTF